jgi:hypothetical protein
MIFELASNKAKKDTFIKKIYAKAVKKLVYIL